MADELEQFGALLAIYRLEAGETVARIKERTGLSERTINRMEAGSVFSFKTFITYLKAIPKRQRGKMIEALKTVFTDEEKEKETATRI